MSEPRSQEEQDRHAAWIAWHFTSSPPPSANRRRAADRDYDKGGWPPGNDWMGQPQATAIPTERGAR